jgi:hypothetical protein
MLAPDQVSQFHSAASVYAPSLRIYNELDDDGSDIEQEINQDFNAEYLNDNDGNETETANENDYWVDCLSHNFNPNRSSNRGCGDSSYYLNSYNYATNRPGVNPANRGQFTRRQNIPLPALNSRPASSRYLNSTRDPRELGLDAEMLNDEMDVQTGYEIEAVKPRAVVASQSDF